MQAENVQLLQHMGRPVTVAATLDYTAEPVEDWLGEFMVEQKARAEAEARADRHGAEATHLKEENQLLRQKMENLAQDLSQEVWKLVEPLKTELEELRSVHSSGSPSRRRPARVVKERRIVVGPRPPFDDSWTRTQSRSF